MKVTHAAGEPLDPDKIYRVYTKISDLTNGQSPPWTEFYTENSHWLPPKGAYVNIHAELMHHFARNLWLRLWNAIGDDCKAEKMASCSPGERLDLLDQTGDGILAVEEIQMALRDRLGMSIDKREQSLAEFVHDFADQTGDGTVVSGYDCASSYSFNIVLTHNSFSVISQRLVDMEVFSAELGAEIDDDMTEGLALVDELAPGLEEGAKETADMTSFQ